MAELLIKAINHTHSDPIKDRRGAYKRGMVVGVQADGHQWGAKEALPRFVIVKIPGVPNSKVKSLLSPQTEDDNGTLGVANLAVFRRRRWRLNWNNLPPSIKQKLRDDGEITTTKAQIRNYLKRIRDNAQYTEMD